MPVQLSACLDTAAAAPLRLTLVEALKAGQPIEIDGSAVTEAGLACLQVLESARLAAAAAGTPFTLTGPSEALQAGSTLAGLAAAI